MYFFIRTNNPRPTFHIDMSVEEREIMRQHIAYWSEYAKSGIAVVFGPVMDPAGYFGIGVYQAQDEAEMQALITRDPANGLLSYVVTPMAAAVVGDVQTTLKP